MHFSVKPSRNSPENFETFIWKIRRAIIRLTAEFCSSNAIKSKIWRQKPWKNPLPTHPRLPPKQAVLSGHCVCRSCKATIMRPFEATESIWKIKQHRPQCLVPGSSTLLQWYLYCFLLFGSLADLADFWRSFCVSPSWVRSSSWNLSTRPGGWDCFCHLTVTWIWPNTQTRNCILSNITWHWRARFMELYICINYRTSGDNSPWRWKEKSESPTNASGGLYGSSCPTDSKLTRRLPKSFR